ncbi:MAG: Clp protease N-terminal domain-containing protein [Acidimicrobiales bacterium]
MFERFTDRARRVIVLAQDAAREMGHAQIRPEHLLVGLQQSEGLAADAMSRAGVDGDALRRRVADRYESTPGAKKVNKVPFSTEAKRCLEQSLRAALALGHNHIGTEHLFLGVQREAEADDRRVDDVLGAATAEVQRLLTDMLGGAHPGARSPALQSALGRARGDAGRTPVTTGHLLRAILADPDSQVSRAVADLDVGADRFAAALDAVDVDETSDASPASRSVVVAIGESTTVVADAGVAAALQRLTPEQLRDVLKRAVGQIGDTGDTSHPDGETDGSEASR